MTVDSFHIFTVSNVAVAPSPGTSGLTMSILALDAAAGIFPAAPFNLTCSPAGVAPTIYNSEVVRVLAMGGANISSMLRAQEGTTAQDIQVGWIVEQGVTPLTITQLVVPGIGTISGDITTPAATAPDQSVAATLATVATAGTVGDATHYPIITMDAKGRVTTAIAQIAPASANGVGVITGDITTPAATAPDQSVVSTLATVATAGTYGSAVLVPEVTIDAKGRVTSIATVAPSDVSRVSKSGDTMTGQLVVPDLSVSGLTGAVAGTRIVGGTTTGAPTTGTWVVGDQANDQTGKIWICTTAGTPGTWTQVGNSAATTGAYTYVANYGSNNVSVINTLTNLVVATITVGSGPIGVAITPDGSHVYVTNYGAGTVSVITVATNVVAATVTVGTNPFGVAITPNGASAYVANQGAGTVSVITVATNVVAATVTVGTSPYGVAITPNGAYAYVANLNANTVSVITVATNVVAATINTFASPRYVASALVPIPPTGVPTDVRNQYGQVTAGNVVTAPSVVSGTAFTPSSVLDSMVYFQINAGVAGTYTLTMGPGTGAEHTVGSAVAMLLNSDDVVTLRVPAAWLVVLTLVSVTLGSTLVITA